MPLHVFFCIKHIAQQATELLYRESIIIVFHVVYEGTFMDGSKYGRLDGFSSNDDSTHSFRFRLR